MRDYPLADDKYAIEQLASRYSFIDINKVGIYGHSGGGFYGSISYLDLSGFFIKLLFLVPVIMIIISIIADGENVIMV